MRINLNGPILSALTRVFDTIMATVLFLVCCLPVATIGASFSAMYATMISIAGDGCSSVVRCFFGAFKENFKQATILWLLAALTGLLVAADITVCWGFEMAPTMVLSVMRGLTVFCTALYAAMYIYIFAGITIYHVTWKQAVANAFYWTMKKLPATLCLLLLGAIMAVSVFVFWFFAFPVIVICFYMQAKMLRRVFGIKLPEAHLEEEIDY